MERETGIEPATSSLGSWRSTAELLPLAGQSKESLAPAAKGDNRIRPPVVIQFEIGILRRVILSASFHSFANGVAGSKGPNTSRNALGDRLGLTKPEHTNRNHVVEVLRPRPRRGDLPKLT